MDCNICTFLETIMDYYLFTIEKLILVLIKFIIFSWLRARSWCNGPQERIVSFKYYNNKHYKLYIVLKMFNTNCKPLILFRNLSRVDSAWWLFPLPFILPVSSLESRANSLAPPICRLPFGPHYSLTGDTRQLNQ